MFSLMYLEFIVTSDMSSKFNPRHSISKFYCGLMDNDIQFLYLSIPVHFFKLESCVTTKTFVLIRKYLEEKLTKKN